MTNPWTFDPVRGPARESIDAAELPTLPAGSYQHDPRRVRPNYVDGRFLTARDLTRDQQYALIRQADLGQVSGGGVLHGLEVSVTQNGRALSIRSGHGLAPHGETVVLRRSLVLPIAAVPVSERLGGTLGLDFVGNTKVGTTSGLFTIALRAVEFVDSAAVAFPTTVGGRASIEPGQISEATLVTLIPLDNLIPAEAALPTRSVLAREIFLRGGMQKLAGEALPLGVVALERGVVSWLDVHLVRRRAGVDNVVGFGLNEHVNREAYWQQFADQLRDILYARAQQNRDRRVIATEYFGALPPFGWLPREVVEIVDQTLVQWFFPPEFNVELSLVPQDELSRVLEEAAPLTAFDLSAPESVLESCPVMMLIPVARDQFSECEAELQTRSNRVALPQTTRPTMRVQPIEALDALRRRRIPKKEPVAVPVNLAPWESLLAKTPFLFYVRRRQFSPISFIVPRFEPVQVGGVDPVEMLGLTVRERLIVAGEAYKPMAVGRPGPLRRFDLLLQRVPEAKRSEVLRDIRAFFELDVFEIRGAIARCVLVNGAAAELAYRARVRLEEIEQAPAITTSVAPATLTIPVPKSSVRVRALRTDDVQKVRDRYEDPDLGKGFIALKAETDKLSLDLNALAIREVIAQTLLVPEIDKVARNLTSNLAAFAKELHRRALAADLDAIIELVRNPSAATAARGPARVGGADRSVPGRSLSGGPIVGIGGPGLRPRRPR